MIVVRNVTRAVDLRLLNRELVALYPGAVASLDVEAGEVYVDGVAESALPAVAAVVEAHNADFAAASKAEIVAARRAEIAGQAAGDIEGSPLARAILENGDLSEYTTEEIVAEQGRLLRLLFAALDGAVAWPDWSRAARA
jgi:hypothetical protein